MASQIRLGKNIQLISKIEELIKYIRSTGKSIAKIDFETESLKSLLGLFETGCNTAVSLITLYNFTVSLHEFQESISMNDDRLSVTTKTINLTSVSALLCKNTSNTILRAMSMLHYLTIPTVTFPIINLAFSCMTLTFSLVQETCQTDALRKKCAITGSQGQGQHVVGSIEANILLAKRILFLVSKSMLDQDQQKMCQNLALQALHRQMILARAKIILKALNTVAMILFALCCVPHFAPICAPLAVGLLAVSMVSKCALSIGQAISEPNRSSNSQFKIVKQQLPLLGTTTAGLLGLTGSALMITGVVGSAAIGIGMPVVVGLYVSAVAVIALTLVAVVVFDRLIASRAKCQRTGIELHQTSFSAKQCAVSLPCLCI